MKKDLTLKRIKNTGFQKLYEKFLLNRDITELDYYKILSIATIFCNSGNMDIANFGYRIILIYCNRVQDYRPLYEIAINLGFIPVAKLIESSEKLLNNVSFFTEINSAFFENFREKSIYKSEQQQELYEFYLKNNKSSLSVIAPTSYGKTELILSLLKENANKKICIITPTKSLLAQTKMRILNSKIDWIDKVVTQPEMYNGNEKSLVAVLTQERLLRLLKLYTTLSFDFVIIDEAHGLLSNSDRGNLLASVIIILDKRKSGTIFKYLTPFLSSPENLNIRFTDFKMSSFKVTEYIKSERFYVYDERDTKKLLLYDQFIDRFYVTNKYSFDDLDFIINKSGNNNIVYLNKPKDIEDFAYRLSEKFDDLETKKIENACVNLKEFIHPQYDLLNCLKKGIIYHHGSVPDSIRLYIEHLFSTLSEVKYVITTSTLLEGVNLPADKLFILDNRKGFGYLSPSHLKNLIGRICRFNEIFKGNEIDLIKLEPEVYFVTSLYYRKNAKIEDYLKKTLRIEKEITDDVKNVLLKNTELNDSNLGDLKKSKEFLENYEKGTINDFNERRVKTNIGQLCFSNNITEIDIFESEEIMQEKVNLYIDKQTRIEDTKELFDILNDVFFYYIIDKVENQNLLRFKYEETRNFYNMFLNWRIRSASYNEMISAFIKHWERLINEGKDTLVYVGRWGDLKREGFKELWTDIANKTYKQKINLAIVRIKEEQDFLDNFIIKFIEVLNDLTLINNSLYLKIKYGTDNMRKILLVKNGLSLSLSNLISDWYSDYLDIDLKNDVVKFKPNLIDTMKSNDENEILIYEMSYFVNN